MHNFTLFYCKELLQKMQISIFEKYIPLHELQRNKAGQSILVLCTVPSSRTERHPGRLGSPRDPPKGAPPVPAPLPSFPPIPVSHTCHGNSHAPATKGRVTKSSGLPTQDSLTREKPRCPLCATGEHVIYATEGSAQAVILQRSL